MRTIGREFERPRPAGVGWPLVVLALSLMWLSFVLGKRWRADEGARFHGTLAQTLAAAAPTAPVQTVFGKTERGALYVAGREFEGHELRVILLPAGEAAPAAATGPATLLPGRAHAWPLPELPPGHYRAALLIDGRSDREIWITVRK